MRSILIPPDFADEGKTLNARLTWEILLILMAAVTVVQLIEIFVVPANAGRWLTVIGVVNVTGLIYLLMVYRGYVTQASYALVLTIWALVTVLSISAGGIHAPAAAGFLIAVFVAGLLLGALAGIMMGLICSLTGLGFVLAEYAGRIPPSVVRQTATTVWLSNLLYTGIIIGLMFLATRTVYAALSHARRELEDRQKAEAALRENQERFQLVLKNSPMIIYTTDRLLRYTWIYTPEGGVNPRHMIGKRDEELYPEEQVSELVAFKRSVLESGVGARKEIQVSSPDGTITYDMSAEPLRDAGGRIVGLTVAAFDLTDHKNMEEERLQTQARLAMRRMLTDQLEKERLRIARDLHDGPVQELVASTFGLQGAILDTPDPRIRESLQEIQMTLQRQVEALRNFAGEMRPAVLMKFGLARAIQDHLETFQQKHPELRVELATDPEEMPLPDDVRLVLFRIYQEALNNIVRHAEASQVNIRLSCGQEKAEVTIADDGKGFRVPKNWVDLASQGHLGLVGIQERAETAGGKVEIRSQVGKGTVVHVTVPVGSSVVA